MTNCGRLYSSKVMEGHQDLTEVLETKVTPLTDAYKDLMQVI
jgi:hypothetical protein